jgi:hypothetical protein
MCTLVIIMMAVYHEVIYGVNHQGPHPEYFDVFVLYKWEVSERNPEALNFINSYKALALS